MGRVGGELRVEVEEDGPYGIHQETRNDTGIFSQKK